MDSTSQKQTAKSVHSFQFGKFEFAKARKLAFRDPSTWTTVPFLTFTASDVLLAKAYKIDTL